MIPRFTALALLTAAALLGLAACSTAPTSTTGQADLDAKARNAIARAQSQDPTLKDFMNKAHGYAVLPDVGKGGLGVGGAFGRGQVYEKGRMIGYTTLSQGTVGATIGGQAYDEIIVFETPAALHQLVDGKLTFAAQASAVALRSGASANAKYTDGVAVFTTNEKGLMAEAAVGGQKFAYESVTQATAGVSNP